MGRARGSHEDAEDAYSFGAHVYIIDIEIPSRLIELAFSDMTRNFEQESSWLD